MAGHLPALRGRNVNPGTIALAGKKRPWPLLFGVAACVFALDQASKAVIARLLKPGEAIPVIQGMFDIVHVRNRGAAFGFLNRHDIDWQFWLFLAATLIAIWAILVMAAQGRGKPMLITGLGLILGGACGNLMDRIRCRSVLDFLDFYLGSWHWPAFNVADMGICAGVFLACIASLGKTKPA